MKLNIQDSFSQSLAADPNEQNSRRQVMDAAYSYVLPIKPSQPSLIHVSDEMLAELGISAEEAQSENFLHVFSGAKTMEGSKPYAMCYGGHQFGHWAGQLGDGRAINLAEIICNDKRWALQLKGAGPTPYSRSADGLAVLRSSIREHLCSEAMHHLGVPTTRSLSLCLSGDQVFRDIMYDGNGAYEKGAIVCRVAPSFVRFGNFQIFASRRDVKNLKALSDYTINHFFPSIQAKDDKERYIAFFDQVMRKTLEMVIHWQRVGFVHGVMNTDNMSILGLTIDYGPYGWLEGFQHTWTPNTTDRQHARYRYGNQIGIALWNLYQLANALVLLIERTDELEASLATYKSEARKSYQKMMLEKLGLLTEDAGDEMLIRDLEKTLTAIETDMTIFFRLLSNIKMGDSVDQAIDCIRPAFYDEAALKGIAMESWIAWFKRYMDRLDIESLSDDARWERMKLVNPKFVLRNYMAQLAIDAADEGDYSLIDEMYRMLKRPYDEQPEFEQWFAKRPEWARHKVGCSMLSCSS